MSTLSLLLVSLLVQSLAVPTITCVLFLLLPERCNAETANVPATDTSCQGNFRTHSTEQVRVNANGKLNDHLVPARVAVHVGMFGGCQAI